MTLNLNAPTSWSELSQQQLAYLLKAIAVVNRLNIGHSFRSKEDFSAQVSAQVAIRCLFHWNNLRIVSPYNNDWIISNQDGEFIVSSADLAAATAMLPWISSLPDVPVRLNSIDGASAVSADIEDDLSFDDYLACEACWQVWNISQNDSLLREMAALLYRKKDIKLKEFELLSIFYWWAGLKSMLSKRYPNFFHLAPVESEAPVVDELSLRRSMDSQIRALTKGDITKEVTVLSLPAVRAITELDALAKEYDELNRKYGAK